MESLYCNLSQEEFSKGRKVLLWIFAGLFFLSSIYVVIKSLISGNEVVPMVLSLIPFGIGVVVSMITIFATMKRENLFFRIDDSVIEYRYGLLRPTRYSFKWNDISELVMPHKQRKAKLLFKDGSEYIINLAWLHKKKSTLIRKHMFHQARSLDLKVTKVVTLS